MNEAKYKRGYHAEFRRLNSDLLCMKGYSYVQMIWEDADKPLSPTELYCKAHREELPDATPDYKTMFLPEVSYTIRNCPNTPIPCTDQKSIREIRARAEAMLNNLNNARQDGDETMIAYCQSELKFLWQYLSTSVSKSGRIMHQDNINRKHQLLIYRAVQKFCAKLHESHPELAEHICEHIVIRTRCYWSDVPIKRKG